MSAAPADFTRAGYRALLQALLERGYEARRFRDAAPERPHLILRHDVDLWPEIVGEMARIEADLGLTAVYFFLTDSPLYAIDAPETRAVFEELAALGHEVGLHFDAAAHPDEAAALDRAAADACRRLEAASGQSVETVSFHRPARALLGRAEPIAGRLHAYQPRFFEDMDYCSDSRGAWRRGHPLARRSVREGRALQLLTHPIWWVHDDAGDAEAALARLIAAKGAALKPAVAETVTGYDPATGRILGRIQGRIQD